MLDGELCDHAVGICWCEYYRTRDKLERARLLAQFALTPTETTGRRAFEDHKRGS